MSFFHFDPALTRVSDKGKAWLNSLFIDHAIFRLVWTNFDTVIPGKVYRCNHPTPRRLRSLVHRYKIKTLVNLRGHRYCGSDALSRTESKKLGLDFYDLPFESRGAPHRDRILRLADTYSKMEFPILIHCKSGADRAGLVSALIMLLEERPVRQAMKQLSWKYGHFKHSRTGILDAFFMLYAQQTQEKQNFLDWVRHDYNEQELRSLFKVSKLSSFINDQILHRE